MISGGRRYKHITCEPHSTVSDRAVWSVEADDTNIQLVNLTLPSQTELELYDQWRQTIQTYNLWTSLNYRAMRQEDTNTQLVTSLYSLRQSCMISGGRRYKHTTCEPHSTVSDRARAVWSVEADDTNIQLVNLTQQSQSCMISGELYDQWRWKQTTVWSVEADDTNNNLWTSLNSLRKSCMISGGRRYKHTTCKPHSTVSGRAVWSVEAQRYKQADDTNIHLWTSLVSVSERQTIQTRYKHTTCEPHSTVSERAVWSVEADDTNIQLVNLTQQSQTELYDQWRQTIQTYTWWRQTIQTYNLWTSLYSLRQSCMISGGRRYKHTTCEPHSTVSD